MESTQPVDNVLFSRFKRSGKQINRVIFLDIDGVLALRQNYLEANERGERLPNFDKTAVDNLNRLISETGAVIVVSSAWRHLKPFADLKKMLHQKGIQAIITGITEKRLSSGRGEEISWWLRDHPRVNQFVIIDDDSFDILPFFPDHLVKTENLLGFTTQELYDKARKILMEVVYARKVKEAISQ